LHGKPGTGKTEFTKTLAAKLNMKVYFIKNEDLDGEDDITYRKTALVAAQNLLKNKNYILVVDEGDKLLNIKKSFLGIDLDSKSDTKAWLNSILDKCQCKVIWIANDVTNIDSSTKRRFAYAQEFYDFNTIQREKAWKIQIKKIKINFLDKKVISQLAQEYVVNAGSISLALNKIKEMKNFKTSKERLDYLKNILTCHQQFVMSKPSKTIQLTESYLPEIINTDINLMDIVNNAKRYIDIETKFRGEKLNHLNILLQGPPGTGKTEFVKYLSSILNKEILTKRASDLMAAYVGETEKNIAKAFNEAQETKSILFLDEADSFLAQREMALRTWEITQVNEMLSQMESFNGIFICATNHVLGIDSASLRRFDYKVKFNYLKASDAVLFFNKVLSKHTNKKLSDVETSKLAKIGCLTPGDFSVVNRKNILSKIKGIKDKSEINNEKLIEELKIEVSYKQKEKKIGL